MSVSIFLSSTNLASIAFVKFSSLLSSFSNLTFSLFKSFVPLSNATLSCSSWTNSSSAVFFSASASRTIFLWRLKSVCISVIFGFVTGDGSCPAAFFMLSIFVCIVTLDSVFNSFFSFLVFVLKCVVLLLTISSQLPRLLYRHSVAFFVFQFHL